MRDVYLRLNSEIRVTIRMMCAYRVYRMQGSCMLLAKISYRIESLRISSFSAPASSGTVILLIRCLRTNRLDIGSGLKITVTNIYDMKKSQLEKRSTARNTNTREEGAGSREKEKKGNVQIYLPLP